METYTPRHRAALPADVRITIGFGAKCTATAWSGRIALHKGKPCPACQPYLYTRLHAKHRAPRLCVGCFNRMPEDRSPVADDHSVGCPTGANGTPYYE